MSGKTKQETSSDTLKTVLLVLLVFGLASATIFCILKVGALNEQAALLQACMDTKALSNGCPSAPLSANQISAVRDTAKTIGYVGWGSAFALIFFVGEELMDRLRS